MCGRYTLTADKTQVAKEFRLHEVQLNDLAPQYNIAPGRLVPILYEAPEPPRNPTGFVTAQSLNRSDSRAEPRVGLFRWGLIPSWSKDPSIGSQLINARKETLAEKPSFKGPFQNQRCLILADGFYEWKPEGARKVPYYIHLKSKRPFGFAGLWSHWMGSDGSEIYSCTIITGEPNELVVPIHNRMPVILGKNQRSEWLDPSNHNIRALMNLLESYPADEMEAYPVSNRVKLGINAESVSRFEKQ